MAHREQQEFCEAVRRRFPDSFRNRIVLDVGSLDINGNNRCLFENCRYIGIDIEHGPNVDVVCKAHEWCVAEGAFDTVISTETLEHDAFYAQSLRNMVRVLRPGGLLILTCATTGRPEHGTRRCDPRDSPFTARIAGWCDYYRNLTEEDIREVLDVDSAFSGYEFRLEPRHHDLQFWGVKATEGRSS